VRFMSCNVNSLLRKKAQLEAFMEMRGREVVALQETVRVVGCWRLRFAGYNCIERFADTATAARGVALCVKDSLSLVEVGKFSPHCIFGRVSGFKNTSAAVIFGSVYLPCQAGPLRTGARAEVHKILTALRRSFPRDLVVALGDYNLNERQVVQWAHRVVDGHDSGVTLHRGSGNMSSRYVCKAVKAVVGGVLRKTVVVRPGRAIDHVLTSYEARKARAVTGVQVDRGFTLSDHWAVCGRVDVRGLQGDKVESVPLEEGWRFVQPNRERKGVQTVVLGCVDAAAGTTVSTVAPVMVKSDARWGSARMNPFMLLQDYCDESGMASTQEDAQRVCDLAAANFVSEARGIGKDAGLYQPVRQRGTEKRWHARQSVTLAVRQRGFAFRVWYDVSRGVALEDARARTYGDKRGVVSVVPVAAVVEGADAVVAAVAMANMVAGDPPGIDNREDDGVGTASSVAPSVAVSVGGGSTNDSVIDAKVVDGVDVAWAAYVKARREAKRAVRSASSQAWHLFVTRGAEGVSSAPATYWRWLKVVSGRGRSAGGGTVDQPMWDPVVAGHLLTEPKELAAAWADYFDKESGSGVRVRSDEHWQQFADRVVPGQRSDGIQEVNAEMTWHEVVEQLCGMAPNKAPGPDGVPVWFIRLVTDGVRDGVGLVARSRMGDCVLRLIQFVWKHGTIPSGWDMATVVPIPKKGDLMVFGNHRPISLMASCIKIMCGIAKRRFAKAIGSVTPRPQGGFRAREECVCQAITLHDVVARRRQSGLVSIVTLWDMRKAYDSVPHKALLMKLRRFGFTGEFMRFVEALYARPQLSVRLSSGVTSRAVDILGGVRQGDILSPDLFNFFEFDLSQALEELPGRSTAPGLTVSIDHLLFADDLATIAGSVDEAKRQCAAIGTWLEENNMLANVSKTGMLVVGPEAARVCMKEELRTAGITVHGESIPVVDSAVYLGLLFGEKWSLDEMAQDRAAKGRAMVNAMESFLRCSSIPLYHKALVLKSVVIPAMLYGAELFGGTNTARHLQVIVNMGMRMSVGVSSKSTIITTGALAAEMDITPVEVLMAARRLRLYVKVPTLLTFVSEVVASPWGAGWRSRCLSVAKHFGVDVSGTASDPVASRSLQRKVYDAVIVKAGSTVRATAAWGAAAGAMAYTSGGMEKGRLSRLEVVWPADRGTAMAALVRSRCGGVWTTVRAKQANLKWTQNLMTDMCPMCQELYDAKAAASVSGSTASESGNPASGASNGSSVAASGASGGDVESRNDGSEGMSDCSEVGVNGQGWVALGVHEPEDRNHLWFRCPRWCAVRNEYLRPWLKRITEKCDGGVDDNARWTLLHGGSIAGVQLEEELAVSAVELKGLEDSGYTQGLWKGKRMLSLSVAAFLREVMRGRAAVIKRLENSVGV
jgi:hypothetical protein